MIKPSTRKAIVDFLAEEDGPTAVEYAVMLALIIAVCFGSVGVPGDTNRQQFQ